MLRSTEYICFFCDKDHSLNLDSGTCIDCLIENCLECYTGYPDSNPLCYTCDNGYYVFSDESLCAAGTVENCYKYKYDEDVCQECLPGYFIPFGGEGCSPCSEILENCNTCEQLKGPTGKPLNRCLVCDPGFQWDESLSLCMSCPENCGWCYDEEDDFTGEEYLACGQCYAGYSWDPIDRICRERCDIEGCVNCIDGGCLNCVSGYYYDEATGSCESCESSCLNCYGPEDYQCIGYFFFFITFNGFSFKSGVGSCITGTGIQLSQSTSKLIYTTGRSHFTSSFLK